MQRVAAFSLTVLDKRQGQPNSPLQAEHWVTTNGHETDGNTTSTARTVPITAISVISQVGTALVRYTRYDNSQPRSQQDEWHPRTQGSRQGSSIEESIYHHRYRCWSKLPWNLQDTHAKIAVKRNNSKSFQLEDLALRAAGTMQLCPLIKLVA